MKMETCGAEHWVCDSATTKAEPCSNARLLASLGVASFVSSLHILAPGPHSLHQCLSSLIALQSPCSPKLPWAQERLSGNG